MSKPKIKFRLCFKQLDSMALEQFLFTQREELFLPDRLAVKKVVDLVFDKGGFVAGFDSNNQVQAMFGFFFGDPSEGFENKDLMFIYVAAISKAFRLSRTFLQGITSIMQEGIRLKIDQFRMQASINDRYLNRLYSKFSNPIGQSKTLRGYPVIVYQGNIDDVFSKIGPSIQVALGQQSAF